MHSAPVSDFSPISEKLFPILPFPKKFLDFHPTTNLEFPPFSLFHIYVFFVSPYFDHDAFMQHTMHDVLKFDDVDDFNWLHIHSFE